MELKTSLDKWMIGLFTVLILSLCTSAEWDLLYENCNTLDSWASRDSDNITDFMSIIDGKCFIHTLNHAFITNKTNVSVDEWSFMMRFKYCNISYNTLGIWFEPHSGYSESIEIKPIEDVLRFWNSTDSTIDYNHTYDARVNCTGYMRVKLNKSSDSNYIWAYVNGNLVSSHLEFESVSGYPNNGTPYFYMADTGDQDLDVYVDYAFASSDPFMDVTNCTDESDCPAGFYCDGESGVCVEYNGSILGYTILEVFIKDDFLTPIPNATVMVESLSYPWVSYNQTDSDGKAVFAIETPDLYMVDAVKTGYSHEYRTVDLGTEDKEITMVLTILESDVFLNVSTYGISNTTIPSVLFKVYDVVEGDSGYEVGDQIDVFYTNEIGYYNATKTDYPTCIQLRAFKTGYVNSIGEGYIECFDVEDYNVNLSAFVLHLNVFLIKTTGMVDIEFKVYDLDTLLPIESVEIVGDNLDTFDHVTGYTDINGTYEFFDTDGGYWFFSLQHTLYQDFDFNDYVTNDTTMIIAMNTINESLIDRWNISGYVMDNESVLLKRVLIEFDCKVLCPLGRVISHATGDAFTNNSGYYFIEGIRDKSVCDFEFSKVLYNDEYLTLDVELNKQANITMDSMLTKYDFIGVIYDLSSMGSLFPSTIEGVEVKAKLCYNSSSECSIYESDDVVYTNSLGLFALDLIGGEYLIEFSHPAFISMNMTYSLSSDLEDTYFMIPIIRGCYLNIDVHSRNETNGTVIDRPFYNAYVEVFRYGEVQASGYTSADGRLSLKLLTGLYSVIAYYGDSSSGYKEIYLECPEDSTLNLFIKARTDLEDDVEDAEVEIKSAFIVLLPKLLPIILLLFLLSALNKVNK